MTQYLVSYRSTYINKVLSYHKTKATKHETHNQKRNFQNLIDNLLFTYHIILQLPHKIIT